MYQLGKALAATVLLGSLVGCGPEKFQPKTTGSEEYMEKVKQGQPLYTPPPGAPVGNSKPGTGMMPPTGTSPAPPTQSGGS